MASALNTLEGILFRPSVCASRLRKNPIDAQNAVGIFPMAPTAQ